MMELIFFSKELKNHPIPQLVETLKQMKFDGVDLCVREGYPVNPDNAKAELPKAAKLLRDAGLTIPMVTVPTTLTNPNAPEVDRLLAACHDAGVGLLKPGYWTFTDNTDYWKRVDAVRKDLETWERKAMALGVKIAMHTHSGYNMGLNAAAMMHLVKGFNPAHVGVYLDTTHLLLHGEPMPMAIDMTRQYLAVIGVKDVQRVRQPDKPGNYRSTQLGEGMVDFPNLLKALQKRAIAVPLTMHTEYEVTSEADRIAKVTEDVAYLRRVEAEITRPAKPAAR